MYEHCDNGVFVLYIKKKYGVKVIFSAKNYCNSDFLCNFALE